MARVLCRAVSSLLISLAACSCLPGDTRPPPAMLLVTATSAGSEVGAQLLFSTEDGWSISFERFLMSLGDANLRGQSCKEYSDANYGWILDMLRAGPQKVSLLYALGQCQLSFRIMHASPESVLGQGVTEEDRGLMSATAESSRTIPIGDSLFVRGTAVRDDTKKTFAWSFRQSREYMNCGAKVGQLVDGLTLQEEEVETVDIRVHGEALFWDQLDPARAMLRFDPFADADTVLGNHDGAITMDEIGRVPLADLQVMDRYSEMQAGRTRWKTLAEYVYFGALANIARLNGDRCSTNPGGVGGPPR